MNWKAHPVVCMQSMGWVEGGPCGCWAKWRLAGTPLGGRGDDSVQPYASFVCNMENHQLRTHFFLLPEAEGVRELSKAGILRKCSWGQRVERNLIMLCIKHAIIHYINRCRDIHGIRISRGVFCFVLYFFPHVLVGYLF